MDIRAFKMDGLGNDFVIIDNRQKITNLTKDQIIKICDRNFIGCDQLIFIESSKSSDANLKFFNSDGGESGACGNGTRCVAKLISEETKSENIILSTSNGNLESKILDKNIVTTEIGKALPISVVTMFLSNIFDSKFPFEVDKMMFSDFVSSEINFATHLVPFPHAPDSPPSELKNFKFASLDLLDSININ